MSIDAAKNSEVIANSVHNVLVITGVIMFAVVFALVAVVGGAYLLSAHAIDVNNATQHALTLREQSSQLRAGLPTCRALRSLALDANAILRLPGWHVKGHANVIPVRSFFADFQRVFLASHCPTLLKQALKLGIR